MIKKDIVVHHGDADGYCSAGLISLLNRKAGLQPPVYITANYGAGGAQTAETALRILEGQDATAGVLYVLDFSFSNGDMKKLVSALSPERLVYLDHHATSRAEMGEWAKIAAIAGVTEGYVQNIEGECGASLTLKHIKYRMPELKTDPCMANVEQVVRMCKDYDLWTHKNHHSMPFVTGVSVSMPHPEVWRKILVSGSLWKKYEAMGYGITRQQEVMAKKIAAAVKEEDVRNFDGCRTLVLNLNAQFTNIVSHKVIERAGVDAVLSYSMSGLKDVYISMRTADGCDWFDAGRFMRKWFGGGGHKHAAGGRAESFAEFCGKLESAERAPEPEQGFEL